jgi:hypothetical protein
MAKEHNAAIPDARVSVAPTAREPVGWSPEELGRPPVGDPEPEGARWAGTLASSLAAWNEFGDRVGSFADEHATL